MNENARLLALLEAGEAGHAHAIAGIQASWRDEDHIRALERKAIWEQHEQGARDRDAVRVSLGGESLFEQEAKAVEEAAAKRLAAADKVLGAGPAATPEQSEPPPAKENETAGPDAVAGGSPPAGEVKRAA